MHQRLSLKGVHFPPTCMQAKTFNHSHKCNCLLKSREGTYFRFNVFLCSLSSYWFGVINEASLTPFHSGDCGECVMLLFLHVSDVLLRRYSITLNCTRKKEKEWEREKCDRKKINCIMTNNSKHSKHLPLPYSSFFPIHFLFCFVLFLMLTNLCRFQDYLWRLFLKVNCDCKKLCVVSLIIYSLLWLCSWICLVSLSPFPSLHPVFFCPRSERWLWYLAHLMDCREEMQASQNKLHNKLLAGGKKLCTHNLLMVCKLRAEFAPSSILHLSLPLFSSIPSSPWKPFSLSSTVFWKELQGK